MKHTTLEEEETAESKPELERDPPQSEGRVRAGRVGLEPA